MSNLDFSDYAYCYNCKNFNWKSLHCKSKNKKVDFGSTCIDFDEATTLTQKEFQAEYNIKSRVKEEEKLTDMPNIIHPGLFERNGKLISNFSKELSNELKEKKTLFYRPQSKDVVEISVHKEEEDEYVCFDNINANRFITLIENYVVPGIIKIEKQIDGRNEAVFKHKSITSEIAKTVISSSMFQNYIYKIERIFTVPLPIIYKGKLTFPKSGYDSRFKSWLPFDAPKIEQPDMKLKEAREIILNIYKEFCFKNEQDLTNSISALLTPFLRGLYSHFNTRTPVFFYLANRERAGKDYCAGITSIVYEGCALEEPPISNDEKAKNNSSEELRKKLLSSFITGKQRLHFANNKGHINNSVFEAITTAEKYSDRILGKNEILTFDNELEFSLSGNVGVTYTADFANRCRFINLFLDIEDANTRRFNNPDLHGNLKNRRGEILSALYCFVREWIKKGKIKGETPFTSFPMWADICGGIMNCVDLGDPCKQDRDINLFTGDNETKDMKLLFEISYEVYPEKEIKKADIKQLINDNQEGLFSYLDLGYSKSDQTKFGIMFDRYVGRLFSGIRMIICNKSNRASRQSYKFTKETEQEGQIDLDKFKGGNLGNIGNL